MFKLNHLPTNNTPSDQKSAPSNPANERNVVVSLILQVYNGSYREEFFADSEHGKLYRKIFLSAMRHLPFIDTIIDKNSSSNAGGGKSKTTPALRSIIAMGITQVLFMDSIPDYAAVSTAVELAPKHQKPYVNWILMEVVRTKDDLLANHTIYDDFPEDFINNLKVHCTGNELFQLLTTLNTPPVYWGLDTATGEIVDIAEHATYQHLKTPLELQQHGVLAMDKASAMIALETVALGNELVKHGVVTQQPLHILDACAAPGGKTVAMAKLLPDAQIHAIEINPNRFHTLEEYLLGHKVGNVSPLNMDIMGVTTNLLHLLPPEGDAALSWQQQMHPYPYIEMWDITLLDAPCSCLGTVRRHPEVRIIKNSCDIQALQPVQLEMLHHVATLTKHYIHYCVCSLELGETADVINQFLNTNTDFKLHKQRYIMPHIENSDGFYSAILKRVSDY